MKSSLETTNLMQPTDVSSPIYSAKRLIPAVIGLAIVTMLTACSPSAPTDQQVQRAAAKATVEARQGAKQAVVAAQAAAVVATRQIGNLAVGVRQGMKEKAPLIDLNSASRVKIATLPGISLKKAAVIVAGRPYSSSRELVSRHIVTASQYRKIEPKVTAR